MASRERLVSFKRTGSKKRKGRTVRGLAGRFSSAINQELDHWVDKGNSDFSGKQTLDVLDC